MNIFVYTFSCVGIIQLAISHDFMYGVMQNGQSSCIFFDGNRLDILNNQLRVIKCPMRDSSIAKQPPPNGINRCR